MIFFLILTLLLTAVTAAPYSERIVGGTVTEIANYPFQACLLFSWNGISFVQSCAGSILTYRSVLTAAHCLLNSATHSWRTRVGSTYASSGGVVHLSQRLLTHSDYNTRTYDNDIGILHTATNIVFNNNVKPGTFAGPHYNLPDNAPVWAVGWGRTYFGGPGSDELRHVQVWVINQDICRIRYTALNNTVTDNMLCSGYLDVGGRDQCQGDSGGPLVHNNVIVGICSWGEECALPRFPGVNVRVSRYRDFIQRNA